MKKVFTLAILALALGLTTAQAQIKKTWNFAEDSFSAETIENLQADKANWEVTLNDDGTLKEAKEHTKITGDFIANGEPIKELIGLTRGSAGLSKNNNYMLRQKSLRLNRDKMVINFPKLVNGQTITIVGQSANSTAENRGIKPSYDYIQLIEGPEDYLIKASLGQVTMKFKVVTEETDSVPIQFTMITGGIDFALFQIDEGDIPAVTKVAYLNDGTEDAALTYLQGREGTEVTAFDAAQDITTEGLREYDVTVVGPALTADSKAAQAVKEAMPWTPVLNLNGDLYNAWGYGEVIDGIPFVGITSSKNKLFKGANFESQDESLNVLVINETDEPIKYVKLGDYFKGDAILAAMMNEESNGVLKDTVAIHQHNIEHNGYIYLPYGVSSFTESAQTVFNNALDILASSKADITAAAAPKLALQYKDMNTNVIMTAPRLPKAKIYYTTDGTEPTVENGILYTDTVNVTAETTFKAAAIAEGYTLSNIAEIVADIRQQPKTPIASLDIQEGKTIVTLTCESEDADIWFNFAESTDTIISTKVDSTTVIAVTAPQTLTAFAVTGGAVFSEVLNQRIVVKNAIVRIDQAAHFTATKWDGVENGKGLFAGGTSATSMYDTDAEPIEITTDPDGNETMIYPLKEAEERNEAVEEPAWKVTTLGQAVLWQNLGPLTNMIGTNEGGYYPATASDINESFPITKYDVQFSKTYAGEHANATIQTINKYQAPLDIVTIANMQGGPLLAQVSADGINWTTVGDTIASTGWSRMWKTYTNSYEGTDEVYVRIAQESGSAGCKIFDVYVANQGEKSTAVKEAYDKEYEEVVTGIQTVASKQIAAPAGIYGINGMRLNGMQRGLNIVRKEDGTIKKIMVK